MFLDELVCSFYTPLAQYVVYFWILSIEPSRSKVSCLFLLFDKKKVCQLYFKEIEVFEIYNTLGTVSGVCPFHLAFICERIYPQTFSNFPKLESPRLFKNHVVVGKWDLVHLSKSEQVEQAEWGPQMDEHQSSLYMPNMYSYQNLHLTYVCYLSDM